MTTPIDPPEIDWLTVVLEKLEMSAFKDSGEYTVVKAHQTITHRIEEARIEGEKYGRSDELVKLSEWGKTIDDQWNAHFKERLKQLKATDSLKSDTVRANIEALSKLAKGTPKEGSDG